MKMSEILDAIASLARSQGFYGRLLRDLMRINENDPVRYGKIKSKLEEQKFGSVVDMVLFFECQSKREFSTKQNDKGDLQWTGTGLLSI